MTNTSIFLSLFLYLIVFVVSVIVINRSRRQFQFTNNIKAISILAILISLASIISSITQYYSSGINSKSAYLWVLMGDNTNAILAEQMADEAFAEAQTSFTVAIGSLLASFLVPYYKSKQQPTKRELFD